MGIGDNVRGAAENALKDLAGLSAPNDDAHAPEPGDPSDEIKVHSSISEGSNAGEGRPETALDGTDRTSGPVEGHSHGTAEATVPGDGGPGASGGEAAEGEASVAGHPHGVTGPGGLPEPDPDGLRADPSEGGGDPTTSMGRG